MKTLPSDLLYQVKALMRRQETLAKTAMFLGGASMMTAFAGITLAPPEWFRWVAVALSVSTLATIGGSHSVDLKIKKVKKMLITYLEKNRY